METRNLGADGIAHLTIDGNPKPVCPGSADTLKPSWLHVEGVGGYLLPTGGTLHAKCQDRTGRWTDINHRERMDPSEHTRTWLTLWFEHGVQPVDATYAYVLLPGATTEQTACWLATTGLRIVTNSAQAQAVQLHDPADGAHITLANFFTDNSPAAGGISFDRQASVILRQRDDQRETAVAHPPNVNGAEEFTAEFDWTASAVEHR